MRCSGGLGAATYSRGKAVGSGAAADACAHSGAPRKTSEGGRGQVHGQVTTRGTGGKQTEEEYDQSTARPWAHSVHDGDGSPGNRTEGASAPEGQRLLGEAARQY